MFWLRYILSITPGLTSGGGYDCTQFVESVTGLSLVLMYGWLWCDCTVLSYLLAIFPLLPAISPEFWSEVSWLDWKKIICAGESPSSASGVFLCVMGALEISSQTGDPSELVLSRRGLSALITANGKDGIMN